MAHYDAVVIHFGEMWLKGRNRGSFVNRLYSNIQWALSMEDYDNLVKSRDRFLLMLNAKSDVGSILGRVSKVFGISWFAPVAFAKNDIPSILKISSEVARRSGGKSVRVEASRSYKKVPFTSPDIVGAFLRRKEKLGFVPDRDSDNILYINVTQENTQINLNKLPGSGGLPVGSSGRAVVLLSGGIDSPVASIYAMKRGLEPIYLHVHAFPDNAQAASSKISDLLGVLNDYHGAKSYMVPSHIFQSAIMKVPSRYELVLFKRFLYRLAERIAAKEKADVIVTGESLGQVASQTAKNLIASEKGTRILVMRPLIGFDKNDIVNAAKKAGTFDISAKPYRDVCSFNAKNPSTSADPGVIDDLYRRCKLTGVLTRTLKASLVVRHSK
jgi:thiamine biosynthesis protein ThiI